MDYRRLAQQAEAQRQRREDFMAPPAQQRQPQPTTQGAPATAGDATVRASPATAAPLRDTFYSAIASAPPPRDAQDEARRLWEANEVEPAFGARPQAVCRSFAQYVAWRASRVNR